MKKIDSLHFGPTIVFCIVMLLLIIPFCLYVLWKVLNIEGFIFLALMVSMGLGLLVLLVFIVILAIEFRQDKRLYLYHKKRRNVKIPLVNDFYECQNCGNTKVNLDDKSCSICNIKFLSKQSVK